MRGFFRYSLAVAGIATLVSCQKSGPPGAAHPSSKDSQSEAAAIAAAMEGAGGGAAVAQDQEAPDRPADAPPMDVSAPPADAVETASGLAYKVLAEGATDGAGDTAPGPNDRVEIELAIWRTSGEPLAAPPSRQSLILWQLPPGWIEMLKEMKRGEKRLVWMPPELGMPAESGAPQETMVYQLGLASVTKAPPVPANVAAAPAGATKTESGAAYEVLEKGTGKDAPRAWDQVVLHVTGWTSDGRLIESTEMMGQPLLVPLSNAMPGWSDAVQTMVEGQRNRVWVPREMLQAHSGAPEGPSLVYDLQVVEIKRMPEPPPVPADVAAPPEDAKKTEKGVSYKVLKKGTGKAHPQPAQVVEVHYTGWTTDGEMFDSSVTRGKPARLPLDRVIPGWTDGLQTMVVGEKTRFWIPEELAYAGKPGAPQGMLVFDVELLSIADE